MCGRKAAGARLLVAALGRDILCDSAVVVARRAFQWWRGRVTIAPPAHGGGLGEHHLGTAHERLRQVAALRRARGVRRHQHRRAAGIARRRHAAAARLGLLVAALGVDVVADLDEVGDSRAVERAVGRRGAGEEHDGEDGEGAGRGVGGEHRVGQEGRGDECASS